MGNFSLDAANAASRAAQLADENGNMIVKVAEMVSLNKRAIDDMREWERQRFNCIVDYVKDNNPKITALQEQVAALQKRLYEQEKKNKGITQTDSSPIEP